MKHSIQIVIAIGSLAVFSACSTHDSQGRQTNSETRNSMRRVERNAGEIVEEANHGIQRGVNAVDRSWETPAEQQRRQYDPSTEDQRRKDMDR